MTAKDRQQTVALSHFNGAATIQYSFISLAGTCLMLLVAVSCVGEASCDDSLQTEFHKATTLRQDLDGAIRRPTSEEERELRRVIDQCKSDRTHFDLTGGPIEDSVWGSAAIILLAVELDDVSLLDELVAEGHPHDGLPNSFGISTLYFATYRQAQNAFSWALEGGVDPNAPDTEGISPLMLAAMRSQDTFPSLEKLLEAGALVDATDALGRTAIVFAIRTNRFDNAAYLARRGASIGAARAGLTRELEAAQSDEARRRIQEAVDYLDTTFGIPPVE